MQRRSPDYRVATAWAFGFILLLFLLFLLVSFFVFLNEIYVINSTFSTDQTSERFLLCSPGTSGWWKLGSFPPLCATNPQMPNLAFASMTSVLPCQLVSLKLAPAGRICSQTCYAGT